jgi:hypothetical protein
MTEIKPIVTIISTNGKHGIFDLDRETKYQHDLHYKAFAYPKLRKIQSEIIHELAKALTRHGDGIEIRPFDIEVLEWPSHPNGKGRWMKK